MNNSIKYFAILIIAAMIASCGKTKEAGKVEHPIINETDLLHNFVDKSGNIINSEEAPFLISADDVFSNLGRYLVLDIRDTAEYEDGHIDGALLVAPKSLIDFLDKTVNASVYEKIVITCHTGQTASYFSTLLHLIGYNNVYALKFGMSGWSKKIVPNKILDNLSNKYAGILSKDSVLAKKQYDFPEIKSGENGAYSIMISRVKAVADEGFAKAKINIDTLMKDPNKYFIINYWELNQYNKGHLPGAVQFEPKKSLARNEKLKYLPTDKSIVVYCLSGQTSASVVAYLRVLGYNAYTLSFGSNSFMHDFVSSFNDKAFNPSRDIADYPLVNGKNPSLQSNATTKSSEPAKTEKVPAVVPVKKKQKSSGGGC
jgi:rhodanese-related sulfurtransferase